jgi:hypothetical protein
MGLCTHLVVSSFSGKKHLVKDKYNFVEQNTQSFCVERTVHQVASFVVSGGWV